MTTSVLNCQLTMAQTGRTFHLGLVQQFKLVAIVLALFPEVPIHFRTGQQCMMIQEVL